MAVRRNNHAWLKNVSAVMWHTKRHATCDGHLTLTIKQATAGHVDGDKRGRTRCLHIKARSGQIERVRNAGREKVLIIT
jgi:hypothetical protein